MGQIVGQYLGADGNGHGFLLSGGTFFTIDDPLGGTGATSVNHMGQIVGDYVSADHHLHGFLMVTASNPPPPPGTTADMILRHDADGLYEIYDIGGNAFLAANFLGQVGTDFQVAGLGRFFGRPACSRSTTSPTTTSPMPPRWARSGSISGSPASATSIMMAAATWSCATGTPANSSFI